MTQTIDNERAQMEKALLELYCSLPPAERTLLLEAARKLAGK